VDTAPAAPVVAEEPATDPGAIPSTMRALVVLEPGRMEIQEVAVPHPGPNEVLARVRAVSICGTDAHLIRGDYPGFWPPSFPFIPGHEWAGEIVALGPGAERFFAVGERVAGTSHDACGVCQKCVEGRYNLCENYGREGLHRQYGHNVQGADAEYVVHGVKAVFHLPDGLPFDQGAVVDPASIALHVANRGAVAPGDTVVVTGGGAIGLLSGDAARIRGAARVIVVERMATRLEKAASMGFETVDSSAGDPVRAVRELTGGLGADVVLECAGVPITVRWALDMLRRGGRCAAVGIPTAGVEIPMQRLVLDELELVGCRASAGEMRRVMPLVEQGRMRVTDVMTHRFSLDEYPEAIDTFNDPSSGAIKIIVEP
jgi:L-iditol 2-dehydrogenase